MTIYVTDHLGALIGPVNLPVVPGLGVQLPSNAIRLAKPLPAPASNRIWMLIEGEPKQEMDHRGTVYRIDNGEPQLHSALGKLPGDVTSIPRPSTAYRWENGAWVKDLTFVHAEQIERINSACAAAITGGFSSSALDETHQYSSQLEDQLNLASVILTGLDSPYPCRDEQGNKDFRLHTVAQLRRVSDDFTLFKLQLLQTANQLKQKMDQALAGKDLTALEALAWEDQPS
jgi:hypothetical protein